MKEPIQIKPPYHLLLQVVNYDSYVLSQPLAKRFLYFILLIDSIKLGTLMFNFFVRNVTLIYLKVFVHEVSSQGH